MAPHRLIGTAAKLAARLPGCGRLRQFEAFLAHYGVRNAWRRAFPKKKTPQDVLDAIRLVQMNELRQKKKAILIGTSEHRNIGDAAISMAAQQLLAQQYPEYFQVEFSTYELDDRYGFLQSIIHPEDVFFLNGGGNLGSCYPDEEAMHRRIIADFPHHPVIVLPQTILFEDTEEGQRQLALSTQVYNRHPQLTLFTRGQRSFRLAKEAFPNAHIHLMPDCVFALRREYALERRGVLLCLRTDQEGWLDAALKGDIEQRVRCFCPDVETTTNMAAFEITRTLRAPVVHAELQRYAARRLVVTDRLHGMIFAAVTGTPVVVLASGNTKLEEFYQAFLADSNAVFYVGRDLDQLEAALEQAAQVSSPVYPVFQQDPLSQLRSLTLL